MAAPLGPDEVAVVFNSAVPESEKLASLYRELRHIPAENVIGLKMPLTPDISRAEYTTAIQNPLRLEFEKRTFWRRGKDQNDLILPVTNKIRVLVTLRGVPLRIKPEPKPKDFKEDPKNPVAGRDEAAVDSELAMFGVEGVSVMGALDNKYFRNEKSISEANLPFMVLTARIDAASMATCERMLHDAVETEPTGLWGLAYVDLANKYPQGDKWLEEIVAENLRVGIPTVVDRFNDTLPKNYPMTEAALYYGWYDWHVSGPFLNPGFRFRKGAVAMHLHSFSAPQLTNATQNWSAPLLEKGAAVTIGNVYEPYLQLTHYFDILHQRLLAGYTWVEAAWMAMPVTSWQGVVLGDPLYRPFLHFDGNGKRLKTDNEFLAVRLAAMKWGDKPDEMRKQLQDASERMKSGILSEAVGLRLLESSRSAEAVVWFRNAIKHYVKPADKLRQEFHLIAIQRASPTGKAQALQSLREAKTRYGKIPEAEALAGWLDILDPPPPPPADPGKSPPPKSPPPKSPPPKSSPPKKK
ncbi:MAG: TIGR03790 family protein [Verrucomicrobia bacterium]|nr:TIGR03790 family protein [Verrucomicrobiota bacterium]